MAANVAAARLLNYSRAMWRIVIGAVFLGMAAAGIWIWRGDGARDTGAAAAPAAIAPARPAGEVQQLPFAAPAPVAAQPPAAGAPPAVLASPGTPASGASDAFRRMLEAQPAASAPARAIQQAPPQGDNPFKAALEESERRRAAAQASPFGGAK
jgi:hypothetical protein